LITKYQVCSLTQAHYFSTIFEEHKQIDLSVTVIKFREILQFWMKVWQFSRKKDPIYPSKCSKIAGFDVYM